MEKNNQIKMSANNFTCPECGGTICDRIAGPNEPGRLVCVFCDNATALDAETE